MALKDYPKWVLDQKRPGTEIRLINGKFYLYEAKCVYDKNSKKGRKVTGKYLGRITEADGLVAPNRGKTAPIRVEYDKEYGVSAFFWKHMADIEERLKLHLDDDYQDVIAMAYARLCKSSPLKMMDFHFSGSFLSERYKDVALSKDSLTDTLRRLGARRESIVEYCRCFCDGGGNIIFDGSDMLSQSHKLSDVRFGKTKPGCFDNMVNVMFAFSSECGLPAYYRLLPGDIKDVKAILLSMKEAIPAMATIMADKGFFSEKNVSAIEESGFNFLIPLRRDCTLVDYAPLREHSLCGMQGHFTHEGRTVWFFGRTVGARRVVLYLDPRLREEESEDFLRRVEKNGEKKSGAKNSRYTDAEYHNRYETFGTLSLLTNSDQPPERLYRDYKSRCSVEQLIDSFKNFLDADRTYMQNDLSLEGWMLINLVALQWYYRIYRLLDSKDLISKYSVRDIVCVLSEVRKIRINGEWYNKEITEKMKKLLKKLDINIT